MQVSKSQRIIAVVFLSAAVPLAIGAVVAALGSGRLFENVPLHSAMEAAGALSAFVLARALLLMRSHREDSFHHFWITCAMLSMGALDLLHGIVPPGNLFIWLHSVAGFT